MNLRSALRSDPYVLIVGAGPTGLGAGYRLQELGHARFQLVEREDRVGGLARSFTDDKGFTWDIGGHVMFSHYDYYDRVFDEVMGSDFTLNNRESWVRMCGRWAPYPLQNNIRFLPAEVALECLVGLIRAQTNHLARPKDAANFAEFIDRAFGDGLSARFMRPYNFKVWAHPPEMMNKEWIGERVSVIDYERALRNVVLGRDDFGWGPNNRFKYPLKGGTGEFYTRIGDRIRAAAGPGSIRTGVGVRSVDIDRRAATLDSGETIAFDHLISAMPVDVLCSRVLTGQIPEAIRRRASELRHSSGYIVGLGLGRPCPSTKSWMYFPESDCPFYRVTYLSNYSPAMTPDPSCHYSLLCEISASEFKPVDARRVVEDTIQGLENAGLLEPGERRDIISTWLWHAPYSYPTPTVDRDAILSDVIPWLDDRGILSRGRFGLWKYEVSNTDHTLMQGVEAVNRILHGTPETTMGIRYTVTPDGRGAAEHERAAVAGSGEKRLASAQVEPKAGDVAASTR